VRPSQFFGYKGATAEHAHQDKPYQTNTKEHVSAIKTKKSLDAVDAGGFRGRKPGGGGAGGSRRWGGSEQRYVLVSAVW
jgi:hypothetical protein